MRKAFNIIGMIAGILVLFFGFLVLIGVFNDSGYGPGAAGYLYDSGYATFGADFYTYVTNNAAEAASGAKAAANNTREMLFLVRVIGGFILVAFGLFEMCHFGRELGSDHPAVAVAQTVSDPAAGAPCEPAPEAENETQPGPAEEQSHENAGAAPPMP